MPDKFSFYLEDNNTIKSMTHYEALQVEQGVSVAEITKQKNKLALKFHPDRNLDNTERATHCMKRINEACEVLLDPEQAANYDHYLKTGINDPLGQNNFSGNSGGGTGGGFGFGNGFGFGSGFEGFSSFFNGFSSYFNTPTNNNSSSKHSTPNYSSDDPFNFNSSYSSTYKKPTPNYSSYDPFKSTSSYSSTYPNYSSYDPFKPTSSYSSTYKKPTPNYSSDYSSFNTSKSYRPHFKPELTYQEQLNKISNRLDKLSKVVYSLDTLEKIINDLVKLKESKPNESSANLPQIILVILKKAKTGNEFYAFSKLDTHLIKKEELLLKAAVLNHPLALLHYVRQALDGAFKPLKDSLLWSIQCLSYVENSLLFESGQFTRIKNEIKKIKETHPIFHKYLSENSEILESYASPLYESIVKLKRKNPNPSQVTLFPFPSNMIQQFKKNEPLSQTAVQQFQQDQLANQKQKNPIIHDHNSQMNTLLERVNTLNSDGANQDNLIKIIEDFSSLITVPSLEKNKQDALIQKIKEEAKTADELYATYQLAKTIRRADFNDQKFLQRAAAQNHPLALLKLTQQIMMGFYNPLDDNKSLKWGLQSLRYLEESVIPKCEKENPSSRTSFILKKGLEKIKAHCPILPAYVPRIPESFERLFLDLFIFRNKQPQIYVYEFTLPEDMIVQLEIKYPSERQKLIKETMKEGDLLFECLNQLNNKKDAYDKNSKIVDLQIVNIIESLDTQLKQEINDYIEARLNSTQKKQDLQNIFLQNCNESISNVKRILDNKLGWGDFLINLLRSFANAFIKAANGINVFFGSKHQYTLFSLAKVPLAIEVEQFEKEYGAVLRSSP